MSIENSAILYAVILIYFIIECFFINKKDNNI